MGLGTRLGTRLGRQPLGFIKLGSTAGTLLVGILISLAAHLGYGIKYDIPALLTTVFLNLFMFAVGLKVGPQFFAGLRLDGLKFVTISLLVVSLNFAAVFILSKTLRLAPGFATGIIAGSMTDTAVIGAAAGAVQSGSYQPPAGITADIVMGNVAAGYAIIYLFSLVGIILLIRYLPRLFSVDVVAAAREAEKSYGGGENRLPFSGTEGAYKLPALKVDVRAYRVENPSCFGLPLFEFSEKFEVPVLQLLRGDQVIDFDANPIMQEGDIFTVVAEAKGRGPLVVLNDTIHYARETQKMHTTRMDTFVSPNRGIAGMMNTGKAFFYSQNVMRHTTKSEFSVAGLKTADLPRVEIVYSHADLGGETVDFLVGKGAKGLVLAGVGDGNSTDAVIAALELAAKKGVAVVRSSRVGSGVVDRNVEINDDKLGFVAGMELNAQKARILLMLGLLKTKDPKKLQEFFMEY